MGIQFQAESPKQPNTGRKCTIMYVLRLEMPNILTGLSSAVLSISVVKG